jgi:hypothetical protein
LLVTLTAAIIGRRGVGGKSGGRTWRTPRKAQAVIGRFSPAARWLGLPAINSTRGR